jgi:hypothetical protein
VGIGVGRRDRLRLRQGGLRLLREGGVRGTLLVGVLGGGLLRDVDLWRQGLMRGGMELGVLLRGGHFSLIHVHAGAPRLLVRRLLSMLRLLAINRKGLRLFHQQEVVDVPQGVSNTVLGVIVPPLPIDDELVLETQRPANLGIMSRKGAGRPGEMERWSLSTCQPCKPQRAAVELSTLRTSIAMRTSMYLGDVQYVT